MVFRKQFLLLLYMQRKTRKNRGNKTQKKHAAVVTIGLIYANWCGHCQSLKPEWKKMKYNVMKTPSYKRGNYKFMEIEDADKSKDSKMNAINSRLQGGKLTANGYPTIFKIHGGKIHYYEGKRDAHGLQGWFLGQNQQSNEKEMEQPAANGVQGIFQRMFGGKTKKNKTLKRKD
jgi:thiol-disulfide isomerase/thioredoxin